MAEKRSYTKKNTEYWENRKNIAPAAQIPAITIQNGLSAPNITPVPTPDINYGSTQVSKAGQSYASSGGESTTSVRGRQLNNGTVDAGAFQNIRALPLPWECGGGGSRDYVGMNNAITLCSRAWAGVSVARNAIEVAVEFSNQPLYIKTSNETVKKFFQEWFYAVKMEKLKEQFFREYYRSGNVFLYKFDGKFGPAYYKNFQQSFGTKANKIPIRYSLLNPSNVFVPTGLTYPYTYVRLLSTYDIARLKNPLTEQDKQVYESLPAEVKSQITAGGNNPVGIYIPMDPSRLRFAFYKKQDYEPLAVPMIYPVLPDLEWKMALKKMDMSLARTIERAILLVTTGEKVDQYGGGINQNNIARLQALFQNQTIDRTLVADYTVDAKWLIPDIEEILGPDKYKIVNDDIREGLQSILSGNDKFANAQIKAKIFIQRLEEGQKEFLNEFLMPEIVSICENMGFRTVPKVGFQKIDLQDEAITARIYAQLGQLGILTAEEVVQALETSVLPDADEMVTSQQEYKKARDKGLFNPLIGGQKDDGTGNANGRPPGTSGIKQSTKKVSPIGTSRGYDAFSIAAIVRNMKASEELVDEVTKTLKKRFKVKALNEAQEGVAQSLAKIVMATQPREKWKVSVASTLEKPPVISKDVESDLDGIAETYEVDSWMAGILRHSRTSAPEIQP